MGLQVTCCPLEFASPEMDEALFLRYKVLRWPLNLEFHPDDIQNEWDSFHIGAYTSHETLIGVLVLKPIDKNTIKMRQVAIDENFQSSGAGTQLVQFSEVFAKSKGFSKMELHARLQAVPFYKKLGYKSKGDIFQEVNIDHLFMFKKWK